MFIVQEEKDRVLVGLIVSKAEKQISEENENDQV
jgi:hypothetical protein